MGMDVIIGGCLAFWLLGVGPLPAAATAASTAATEPQPTLAAKRKQLVDEILARYQPYACCHEPLASCLRKEPVCPLAKRLERAIVKMAALGHDRARIEAALAQRRATMTVATSSAKIALDDRFRAGPAKAKVALVVYACPRDEACAKLLPDLHREVTAGRLADRVALFYRPFFPPDNAEAEACGRGLYAAAYQGKFWPYLIHLCLERERLRKTTLRDWVGSHGLDRCIFDHTCEQPGTAVWLKAAHDEGTRNGVTTAPAVFLNGRRVHGPLDVDTIVDLAEEEHDRASTVQAGAPRQASDPKPTQSR
jgi:protein-disulfide isomerase